MATSTEILWNRRTWVLLTGALAAVMLVTTVALPGPAMVTGLAAIYYLLQRHVPPQEALLGTFLFATALASTRMGSNQFMQPLRFPLLALLLLAGLKRFRTWRPEERSAHWLWGLFLLVAVLLPTLINSGWQRPDVQIALLPAGWFIYGTISFHLSEAERTDRFRMFAVLVPAIFLSMVVFGRLLPGQAQLVGRFRGWFGNPNEMSHWWLAATAVLAALTLRMQRRDLLVVLGLATLYLYLRSGSRAPLGGASIIFAGAWLASRQTPRWLRLFAFLGAGALLFVLPLLSVEQLSTFLPESVVRSETLEDGGGRLVAWRFGWEQLQERFWWGGGAGFEEFIYYKYQEILSMLGHQGLSHNSYLAFALNFGVIGGAGLVLSLWYKLGLLRSQHVFLLALPFLVTTFFEGVLTSPLNATTPIWFVGASLVAQELKR